MHTRKLLTVAVAAITISSMLLAPAFASASLTTSQAIVNYKQNYDSFTKDELQKIDQYRSTYSNSKGSLADQIVERAVWYMNNGYMVYGGGYKAYATEGIVDCSNFTSLVYGDFGFAITTAARNYGSVGSNVQGVYAKQVNGYWTLQGTENLRSGDIMTWWKKDSNGNKYIGHVAIYMGQLNGQPAVIGTRSAGNPTAIGIVNDFRWWWGENFFSVQRVLPEGSWTSGQVIAGHTAKVPVIPTHYVLPPQHPVEMPDPTGTNPPPADGSDSGSSTATPGADNLYMVKSAYLRTQPRLLATKIRLLKTGTTVKILKKYNRYYYYVETNDGRKGYVTTSLTYVAKINK